MNCLGKDTAEWESEYFKWVVSREAVCHLCYSLLESELFSFGEWGTITYFLNNVSIWVAGVGVSSWTHVCGMQRKEYCYFCHCVWLFLVTVFWLSSCYSRNELTRSKLFFWGDFLPTINFVIEMKGRCLWWLMSLGGAIQTELTSFGYSERLSVVVSGVGVDTDCWVIVVMTELLLMNKLSLLIW